MEMKLKLCFHMGTVNQKTVELDKEEAKELYDHLHGMFGEKTKTEYIPYYPSYEPSWPWYNQPTYTITTTPEWHSKDGDITTSFTEKL